MKRVFHQSRVSICPQCQRLVAADYVDTEDGLFLEKFCPDHGHVSTRVGQDHSWLSGLQDFAANSFEPLARQTAVSKGCPWDCGECPQHRQKSAFFLFEITNCCDLMCPICLGEPQEDGHFISLAEFGAMTDAVLGYAGPGQLATLGGGEPTLHPQFFELVSMLKEREFGDIWVYTNGRRIARDESFAERLAEEDLRVVLQWDAFDDDAYRLLRGQPLLEEKRQALSHLRSPGLRLGLCSTVVAGVNDSELGDIYSMFIKDPDLAILDIATMAYVGDGQTYGLGRDHRITSQDVVMALEDQTEAAIRASDFSPVSFSHPECLQIAYCLVEPDGGFVPLKALFDPDDYRDLIADKPLLALDVEAVEIIRGAIDKLWATGSDGSITSRGLAALRNTIETLFPRSGALSPEEMAARSERLVKVVLVHSYMDGLNFDVGRAKMCISRTVLPDGRLMPTCAYNVLHRDTPPLRARQATDPA